MSKYIFIIILAFTTLGCRKDTDRYLAKRIDNIYEANITWEQANETICGEGRIYTSGEVITETLGNALLKVGLMDYDKSLPTASETNEYCNKLNNE